MSLSADCLLRFWDLREMSLVNKVSINHGGNDLITCAFLNPAESTLVTGDESGNVKTWKLMDSYEVQPLLFFNAHQGAISSLQLFCIEDSYANLLLTTGLDKNVKLFTEDGSYLGYFGQARVWDLTDPSNGSEARAPKQPRQYFVSSKSPRNTSSSSFGHEETKVEKVKPIKYININQNKPKPETTSSDVFRKINIEKFKVEQIPMTLEESYRSKTGKNMDLSFSIDKRK